MDHPRRMKPRFPDPRPRKAVVNLGIKFRNESTFWITLFHEIAHRLLHIETPEDIIPEYQTRAEDEREQIADRWAFDTLLSESHALEFLSGKPEPWELERFAENHKIHPAIAAGVCNRDAGKEVFAYLHSHRGGLALKKKPAPSPTTPTPASRSSISSARLAHRRPRADLPQRPGQPQTNLVQKSVAPHR